MPVRLVTILKCMSIHVANNNDGAADQEGYHAKQWNSSKYNHPDLTAPPARPMLMDHIRWAGKSGQETEQA